MLNCLHKNTKLPIKETKAQALQEELLEPLRILGLAFMFLTDNCH